MKPLKIQNCVTPRDSHSFEKYLQDINRYPLITPEDEVHLAEMYRKTHDNAYLEKLVNANLRFVVSVAKNFEPLSVSTLLADLSLYPTPSGGFAKAYCRQSTSKVH